MNRKITSYYEKAHDRNKVNEISWDLFNELNELFKEYKDPEMHIMRLINSREFRKPYCYESLWGSVLDMSYLKYKIIERANEWLKGNKIND